VTFSNCSDYSIYAGAVVDSGAASGGSRENEWDASPIGTYDRPIHVGSPSLNGYGNAAAEPRFKIKITNM